MKYNTHKVKTPYGVFDSQSEYKRFIELKHLEHKGDISDLKQQVRTEIIPALTIVVPQPGKCKPKIKTLERAAHYTVDFTYMKDGVLVYEEVKSPATALARDYPLRRKLMRRIIQDHNAKGLDQWAFNEIIYG